MRSSLRLPATALVTALTACLVGLTLSAVPTVAADGSVATGKHVLRTVKAADGGIALEWVTPPTAPTFRISDATSYELPDTPAHRTLGTPGERAWISGSTTDDSVAPSVALSYTARAAGDPTLTYRIDDVVAPAGGTYQTYRYDYTQPWSGLARPLLTHDEFAFVTPMGTGRGADGTEQSREGVLRTVKNTTGGLVGHWVHRFTRPGLYCVSLSVEGTLSTMTARARSAPVTLRFAVGDAVPDDAACGTSASGPTPEPTPEPTAEPTTGPTTGPTPEPTPEPTVEPTPEPTAPTYVMRSGHADVVAPRIVGDTDRRLVLDASVDGHGRVPYRDLVVVHPDLLRTTVPSGDDWAFLGTPGQPLWNSPQSSGSVEGGTKAFPWIGSSSEDDALVANGRRTDMAIEQVAGPDGGRPPGDLSIWTGSSSPYVLVSTRGGVLPSGTPAVLSAASVRNHAHYNWSFSAPGVYCLAVSAQTEIAGDLQVRRDWLTMVVGDTTDAERVVPCARRLPPPTEPAPGPTELTSGPGPHVVTDDGHVSLHPTTNAGIAAASWNTARQQPVAYTRLDDTVVHLRNPTVRSYLESLQLLSTRTLRLDTLGVPASDGGETLELLRMRGPGPLHLDDARSDDADRAPRTLRPREETVQGVRVQASLPGRYCVDLRWTNGRGERRDATLTLVVDGPVRPSDPDSPWWRAAEHGALSTTCAAGAEPEGPSDPGPTPEPTPSPTASPTPTPSPTAPTPSPTPTTSPTPPVDEKDPVYDAPNGWRNDAGATIIDEGHVDLASRVIRGALTTHVKDSATGRDVAWRPFTSTVLHVGRQAAQRIPAGANLAFLGRAGDPVWLAPETQDESIVWPGWSTEAIPDGTLRGGVRWRLLRASGPGEMALFTSVPNGFGTVDVRFNTRDGITSADAFTIPPRTHAHGTWAFSAEGVYCLDSERTATSASGRTLRHRFTLAVAVGRTDLRTVDPKACFRTDGRPGTADTRPVPDASLTDATTGGVRVLNGRDGLVRGSQALVSVPDVDAGEWVSVWLHSRPRWLGWAQVDASGALRVRMPADARTGDHRLVVKRRSGELVGWDHVTLTAAPRVPAAPRPGGSNGGSGGSGDGGPGAGGSGARAALAAGQTCVPQRATVISSGHADYATRLVGGRLRSLVGTDGSGAKVYRDPKDVVLWVKPGSKVRLPAGLGAVGRAGSSIYQVPQTQVPDLVWLGWNTESLDTSQVRGSVRWRLDSVQGPGSLRVYTAGTFGGVERMVFDGPGTTSIPLGVHAHANWAFSKPGFYRVAFTQRATRADGKAVSDRSTLTFAVGDVDPAAAASGGGCGALPQSDVASQDRTLEESAEAAAQDRAEAAAVARGLVPDSDAGTADRVLAALEKGPVRLLLGVLGGLLLATAAGALWWRRRFHGTAA